MKLSNLEQNGTLALVAEGENKSVTMLTDTNAVPYNAYYEMPNGYAAWCNITVSGNVFTVRAKSNLYSGSSRSVVIKFCCLPTSSGTLQTQNVTATQAADSLSVTFDPTSVSLAYDPNSSDTVALTGVPNGSTPSITGKPSWLSATLSSPSSLTVVAEGNKGESSRGGDVMLTVEGRTFYLPVTQAANTLELTFDDDSIVFGYETDLTDSVAVTGVPVGASVTLVSPSWVSASYGAGTLSLTAAANTTDQVRSGSVELVVYGMSFYVSVEQAANPYPNGKLVLDDNANTFAFTGGTLRVTATEMPTDATEMNCEASSQGNCAECGDTGAFVVYTRVTATSFDITVLPQDVFDGIERSFLLTFSAGSSTAQFTVTQAAPPAVYRFKGFGDKYLKSESSPSTPAFLAEATAQQVHDALKIASWSPLSTPVSPLLVEKNRDNVPTVRGSLEAFKACYAHVTSGSTEYHKVSMGAMAYSFTFLPSAYGLVLRGIRFQVRTDSYCVDGMRATVTTNETDSQPSSDWNVVRSGSGGFVQKGFAPRWLRSTDNLYYGSSKTVVFDGLNVTIGASTKIRVYLTMEDYPGVLNGWVYGSGVVSPSFDFYSAALPGGMSEGDVIAEPQLAVDPISEFAICNGSVVEEPKPLLEETTREIAAAFRDFSSLPYSGGFYASALMSALFSQIARTGLMPVPKVETDFSGVSETQFGLGCSLRQTVPSSATPFSRRLAYNVSPLVITLCLPDAFSPTRITLKNLGVSAVEAIGTDITLSVYWCASKAVPLSTLAPFMALPAFVFGASKLTVAPTEFVRIAEYQMPDTINPGESVSFDITTLSDRWGTLLVVPRISRLGVSEFTDNVSYGLVGVEIDDMKKAGGSGWKPEITLEV